MKYTDRPRWKDLIAAIIAAPADDLPRLVAADWLDSVGEYGRAEFIRIQCELVAHEATKKTGQHHNGPDRARKSLVEQAALLMPAGSPKDTYRRGFVCEVHCKLDECMGGPCSSCGGSGIIHNDMHYAKHYSSETCITCKGTGGQRGIGPNFVREQPIERITITDREPYVPVRFGPWYWYNGQLGETPNIHPQSDLPPELVWWDRNYASPPLETRKQAESALSDRLLAWAKSQPVRR